MILTLRAWMCGLVCAALPTLSPSAQTSDEAVALPQQCGTALPAKVCESSDRCDTKAVLDVPDAWHGLAQCLRALRDIWHRQGETTPIRLDRQKIGVAELVHRQVAWELRRPRVRIQDAAGRTVQLDDLQGFDERKPHSIALLNDIGRPYNSMGQSGLAYFLYQFAILGERSTNPSVRTTAIQHRWISRAIMNTVLMPVAQGGLATTRACRGGRASCTWFHSITRRDRDTAEGATLNQHLHAVRDLALMHKLALGQAWPEHAQYQAAFAAGVRQLFMANSEIPAPPALESFLAPETGSSAVRWAFYGYSPKVGRGYFLGSAGRDCNYHIHSLQLLDGIIGHALDSTDPQTEAIHQAAACGAPLSILFGTLQTRITEQQPSNWSNNDGRDYACPALDSQNPPMLSKLTALLSHCGKTGNSPNRKFP